MIRAAIKLSGDTIGFPIESDDATTRLGDVMATREELRQAVQAKSDLIDSLRTQMNDASVEYHEARKAYAERAALEDYGLRVGDIVESTSNTIRAKTYRLSITEFWTYATSYIGATGMILKKDGTRGERISNVYLDHDKWTRVENIE